MGFALDRTRHVRRVAEMPLFVALCDMQVSSHNAGN